MQLAYTGYGYGCIQKTDRAHLRTHCAANLPPTVSARAKRPSGRFTFSCTHSHSIEHGQLEYTRKEKWRLWRAPLEGRRMK